MPGRLPGLLNFYHPTKCPVQCRELYRDEYCPCTKPKENSILVVEILPYRFGNNIRSGVSFNKVTDYKNTFLRRSPVSTRSGDFPYLTGSVGLI